MTTHRLPEQRTRDIFTGAYLDKRDNSFEKAEAYAYALDYTDRLCGSHEACLVHASFFGTLDEYDLPTNDQLGFLA